MNKKLNYLFICSFGQSRSRFFAEKFMQNGFKSLFCGYDLEADFRLNEEYLNWADVVIVLDKYLYKSEKEYIESWKSKLQFIDYHLEDRPETFNKIYPKLVIKVNKSITL